MNALGKGGSGLQVPVLAPFCVMPANSKSLADEAIHAKAQHNTPKSEA